MNTPQNTIYNGDTAAGALLVEESRKIAHLLLHDVNSEQWHKAIIIDNILQKRSPSSAQRQVNLIKKRLIMMDRELWELIYYGSSEITSQALLAASIKYSRLVGDFMDTVLREHWQTFTKTICDNDWIKFLEVCAQVDPKVETWKESTRKKLKQVVFRMLAEAKYIDNTTNCNLIPVSITPEIEQYLLKRNESYVLKCMNIR